MTHVLGIDVSSHAIDLIRLDETSTAAEWTRLDLGDEKVPAFERCRQVQCVMPQASFYEDVYLIAIERPKTHSFISAAAQFPVFGAVLACLPYAIETWDVSPGDWRKGIGLKGNAKKDECARAVNDLGAPSDTSWPQDAFDAFAVAYYARELNARGIALEEAREKQLTL